MVMLCTSTLSVCSYCAKAITIIHELILYAVRACLVFVFNWHISPKQHFYTHKKVTHIVGVSTEWVTRYNGSLRPCDELYPSMLTRSKNTKLRKYEYTFKVKKMFSILLFFLLIFILDIILMLLPSPPAEVVCNLSCKLLNIDICAYIKKVHTSPNHTGICYTLIVGLVDTKVINPALL